MRRLRITRIDNVRVEKIQRCVGVTCSITKTLVNKAFQLHGRLRRMPGSSSQKPETLVGGGGETDGFNLGSLRGLHEADWDIRKLREQRTINLMGSHLKKKKVYTSIPLTADNRLDYLGPPSSF